MLPLPPVLCELSSLEIEQQVGRRGSKAWSEGVAGRRGRRRGQMAWSEDVAGRSGRKAWPESVVDNLALGFESLYPAVP